MSHHWPKWLIVLFLLALTLSALPVALAQTTEGKIEQALLDKFATEGRADFIVRFAEQADLSPAYQMNWQERGDFVVRVLSETARRSQARAKALLDGLGLRYHTFIAGNELYVWKGDLASAQALAGLSEVAFIRAPRTYHIDPIVSSKPADPAPQALDWGIVDTGADDFWAAFGMQGDGIVVSNIDTGVQWNHPALDQAYRCPANPTDPSCWYDPSNICAGTVCDNVGHGTHTMGTMVGDDDPSLPYQVGMAPNARFIMCKGCETNFCSEFALNACADWILQPGGNPANRPHVVNNSWGGGGCDTWYLAKVQAWRAAGVFPAFSAGNSGSGCNTLGSPGDYQESFASAAHDSSRTIADFSSRGPSCFGHDPYTKPNISAPGVDVCSSVPTNSWDCTYSGTSMSSPHSAGAVALLWSCNPGLIGQIDQTFEILQDNADTPPAGNCGAPPDGEGNYTYGYGYLNVYNAGLLWCGSVGYLDGHVTDASTGNPIAGATVSAVRSGFPPVTATTDPNGYYTKTLMVGTYTVTASAYGYLPETVYGVVVDTDTVTTQDFALTPAETYVVSGTVTDATTGWPLYARIDIDGYPYSPVWTDPVSGYYNVTLAAGIAYTFHVSAWVNGYLPEDRPVGPLTGDRTEDFALLADAESCGAPGYHPDCYYFEGFEAGDGGFTVQGPSSWAWGVPTSGPGAAHGGNNVWATNLAGNYNNSEDGYLTSPDIDLSGLAGQGIYFSWWQWLRTESGYDYASVEVSNDGGGSWTIIYGPFSGAIDPEWTKHYVLLDPSYAVSNFRVRFHFTSDSSVTYEGWYVDDLCIVGVPPPTIVYSQNFDSNNGGYTAGGTNSSWAWGAPTSGPGAAHSPPNVWATNLAGNYNDDEDSWVESPDIDLSAYAGQGVYLSWWHWLQTESCCDYGEVQVSNDGGSTWATVWGPTYGGAARWEHPTVALGPAYAVNNFRVRFHLYTDFSVTYPGFYVDDVTIAVGEAAQVPCVSDPGGLVVGNVYDENTGEPLVGALVVNQAGYAMYAQPTPDDPQVDDAFYTLFSPPGDHLFTATIGGGYQPDVETVTVVQSDTVRQDFNLAAGFLDTTPDSMAVTLSLGMSETLPLVLANSGGADAAFEIVEKDRGFQPMALGGTAANEPRADAEVAPFSRQPVAPLAVGDPLFSIDVGTPTGDQQCLGVEWADGYWWVTGGNNGSDPNKLYKLDEDGNLVASYDQPASCSGWGGRDLAYDGTYLYTGCDDGQVHQFDPVAGAWVGAFPGPIAPPRALAYDPNTDHFWTASWDSNIYEFDRNGTIIHQWPNAYTGKYGMAWDSYSPTGPYLWVWTQDPGVVAAQYYFDGSNLTPTGLVWQGVNPDIDIAGGATTVPDHPNYPGQLLFAGMHQSTPDTVWVYDLDVATPPPDVPWLSEAPISGTVPAGGSVSVDITFDAGVVTQTGKYYATLRFKNNTPYSMLEVPVTMTVVPPALPVASFTSNSPVCLGETMVFTDTSQGYPPISFWHWDFGDGFTSTLQNPTHTYSLAGDFLVTLVVTNSEGSDSVTGTVTVNPSPVASFDYNPVSGTVPLTVYFTNTSQYAISPTWAFGDGTYGAGDTVSHTYELTGTYAVTLTVTSPYGCGTAAISHSVVVLPAGPTHYTIYLPLVFKGYGP